MNMTRNRPDVTADGTLGRPPLHSAGASTSVVRAVWRVLLMWRFRLFQRHRYRRLAIEEVAGRPFLVLPEVFNPKLFRTGELLARAVNTAMVPAGSTVLDVGTGSGAAAVVAAARARRVVAVDLNPHAVRCARINAILNGVDDRVDVRHGDLFGPVRGERFDLVLFNPPYFYGSPQDPLERAFKSTDVAERFAAGLPAHLTAHGRALILLSTDGVAHRFLDALAAQRFAVRPLTRRDLRSEIVTIYEVSLTPAVALVGASTVDADPL